jgi:glycosyltransferase involved in cell wall biosynthesis
MLIVGSGPLEQELRATVKRERVPDVHFAGFMNQSEVSEAYACADVFTLLSREHETFGLVVAEAMNFGLPLVVTEKVGCNTDLVMRGHNGYVVSVDDPDSAVVALSRIVGDRELREKMGQASRTRIDEWSPQRTVAGILDACHAVRV